jgi:hypothetical protein
MSDEVQAQQVQPPVDPAPQVDQTIECSMCGRVGGPVVACELCGGNQRFVQKRQYTLTEERRGENPDAAKRYGPLGQVGPERVVGDIVLPKQN